MMTNLAITMTFSIALTISPLSPTPLSAQELTSGQQTEAQQTQARGYWVDTSSRLMWAGKDNGSNVKWEQAVKYCSGLRLAGYSDWRLARLDELQTIYDEKVESPGLSGDKFYHNVGPFTWHVKGGLFLTGSNWTASRIPMPYETGRLSGYAWRYDFNDGRPFGGDELSFSMGKRALCVRASQVPATPTVTNPPKLSDLPRTNP